MAKLSQQERIALTKISGPARAARLGKAVDNTLGCLRATYDFSLHGGATGDISLYDADSDFASSASQSTKGNVLAKLPSGVIVVNVFAHVITAFTSGGSATIDLNIEAANDGLAASAYAGWTAGANIQGIPDFATVGDYVRTTAERTIQMGINTAALTAGKANFFIFYVQRV